MKLIPKTHKGKNKIHEAGTDQWTVLCAPKEVSFGKGLWRLFAPEATNDPWRFSRWIKCEDDKDFDVV